jgi:murein tripeptide amidase MpaA
LTDDNDEVYIAMCYPYTYTDCMKFMDKIIAKPDSSSLIRRTTICKTIAGNFLDMLIITNFKSSQDMIAKRKCLIITGRVHPGESNASFIVEGLIQYLLSNDNDAILLRDRYVFKIVPMLNPDGVIVGNYRCSLSGHDMNR